MRSRTSTDGNISIALMLLAAIGSVLFTLCAGTLVYRSTNRLITAARWIGHTQEVLASLQSASQSVDRIESNGRLYLSTHDIDQLNSTRSAVLRLEATSLHIRGEVSDNPRQIQNLAALDTCVASVLKEAEALASATSTPHDEVFRCRQTINAMSEIEKKLLQERNESSQADAAVSLNSDLAFAATSIIILFVLFGFLLRDAFGRRKIARTARRANQELALTVAALEDKAYESQILTATREEFQLCTTLAQLYVAAAQRVAKLLPGSSGSLGTINNSRQLVEVVSQWGESTAFPDDATLTSLPDVFSPSDCCGLRSGSLRRRHVGESEIHCEHFRPSQRQPESYFCLPMMAYGEAIGVLFVEVPSSTVEAAVEKRSHTLGQMIQLLSISIASLQLRLKLEQQSIRDPLTNLFNRHFMQVCLQKELARSRRHRSPLAVFMLDVDHFKLFNDRFGHAAGDSVLQSVAATLQSSLRAEDIVCRYGGEEFLAILPDLNVDNAVQLADRIRLAVARIHTGSDVAARSPITISIGCALAASNQSDPAELIHRADLALYRAKHEGRNRVVFSEERSTSQLPSP